jgi:hypothetical protein
MLALFFTKVATNRIIVIAQKTIHGLHRNKMDGVLFQIDFVKTYDNVKWPFCNSRVLTQNSVRL